MNGGGDLRIGVDVGGTKIEALAIDAAGRELARERVPSPSTDYRSMVATVREVVADLERRIGSVARIGLGTPGSVSPATGLLRNANSTVMNGRPFGADVAHALQREIRIENDANCFALSEAVDGAGAGHAVVFGVILGTGVGGGIVIDGRLRQGAQRIAGEWGHNEMPSRVSAGLPDTLCWCGRRRCIETYLSGPGLAADHLRATGETLDAATIAARSRRGDPGAEATLARYVDRLAGALAGVVNLLDPDIVVLGGGLSNIEAVYAAVRSRLPGEVFADTCATPVVPNVHGDSSGVRGAAWL